MPWSGTSFSLVYDFVADRDAGAPTSRVSASRMMTQLQDIVDGLELCLKANGDVAATGDIDLNTHRLKNVSSATASTDAPNVSQVMKSLGWAGTFTGTGDAITATVSPAPSVAAGLTITGIVSAANTGAVTFNLNGGGAVAVKDNNGAALAAGALWTGQIITLRHNGTDWRVVAGYGAKVAAPLTGNGTSSLLDVDFSTMDATDTSAVISKIEGSSGYATFCVNIVTAGASVYSSALVPTGVSLPYFGTSAPAGFVMMSGRTIGDASSGATERANADTSALFTLLWNGLADAEAPVSGGRGASASADFAAHKTITLPDGRGRAFFGKDNMGGTTASRVTSGGSGIVGTTLGKAGGAETHTLATSEAPAHTHAVSGNTATDGAHPHTVTQVIAGAGGTQMSTAAGTSAVTTTVPSTGSAHAHALSLTSASTGGGGAHNNMPPALVSNYIIKL